MSKEYLSEEEQYKDILNQEEISRIKDIELQNIRGKYWRLRHEVFLNETEIPDAELEKECSKLKELEKIEIEEYKRKLKNV